MSNPFMTFSTPRRDTDGHPKDFREDIERYAMIRGKASPYQPSDSDHPDYRELAGPRLEYYLWWRDCADNGTLLSADSGYAWLRCTELINSPGNRMDTLSAIIRFTKACSRSMRLIPMVCGLAEEYAIAKGLPLDSVPRGPPFSESQVLTTWDLTRYPMKRPATGALLSTALFNWRRVCDISDDDMEEILYLSLKGMDEITRSSSMKGVVRSTDPVVGTVAIRPFEKFADFQGTQVFRMPVVSLSEGGMRDLLDAIVRQTVRFVAPHAKGAPSVPKTFPKEYRKVVAAAVDAVLSSDSWNERSFRVLTFEGDGFWSDDDLDIEVDEEASPATIRSVVFPEISPLEIGTRLLDSNWDDESDDDVPFVSSCRLRTSYREMDDAQRRFYISWRTKARRGIYGDTDPGYLWLYCTELINHDYEPRAVQEELGRAMEAFYDSFPAPIALCRAVTDHAILHGFDVPATPLNECDEGILYSKLDSDPIGSVTPGVAIYMASDLSDSYIIGNHMLYTAAFTAAVRAAEGVLKEEDGVRIVDLVARNDPFSSSKTLYSGLWHPDPPVMKEDLRFFRESRRASELLDNTIRTALCLVNRRLGKQGSRIPRAFGRRYVDAITRAVDSVFADIAEKRRRRDLVREASRMTIDRDAVRVATDDLEHVTGMMTVEDGEEEPPVVEEVPVKVESYGSSEGWDAFAESLDDVERAYLAAVLAGTSDSFLRGAGIRRTAIEASVNEKAMDAIGDAVVEEGAVYDDYIDDIREALS